MGKPLIAESRTHIAADPTLVWDILTKPDLIRQWDEVPEGYEHGDLRLGSVFEWQSESSVTKLTVSEFSPASKLAMRLYSTTWELDEEEYGIAYQYEISQVDGGCELSIQVGDFWELPDGEDYYDASVDFVEVAGAKIKSLAESRP